MIPEGQSRKFSLFGLSDSQLFALFLVTCLGLFLRMGMVDMVDGTIPIRNDAMEYFSYAANLKLYGTYSMDWIGELVDSGTLPMPDRNRPPGYALFLYPFATWPPTQEMVHDIRVAQVVLDTLTIILAFFIFRHFLAFTPALGATLLVALSPHLVSMNIYLLTETLFTFVLALFMLSAIQAYSRRSLALGLLAGCLLGLSQLIKPTMNPYLLFLAALLLFHRRSRREWAFPLVLLTGMLVTLSPWNARNMVQDLPQAAESKALVSLQNGSYPGLMVDDRPETRGIPHRADPAYDDIKNYGDFFADLAEKIHEEPVKYLNWYLFGKLEMMLSWDMVAGAGDIFVYPVEYSPYQDRMLFRATHALMKMLHPVLMILSLLALVLIVFFNRIGPERHARNVSLTVLGSLLLYFIALHVAVTPLPRYMIPLRPVSYGLAVFAVMAIVQLIRTHLPVPKPSRP